MAKQIKKNSLKTPGGRDRCDICRRAVFENCKSYLVNNRYRHEHCWPAMQREAGKFLQARNAPELLGAICNYQKRERELAQYESEMKSVELCSKQVRDALLKTKNIGLALAN